MNSLACCYFPIKVVFINDDDEILSSLHMFLDHSLGPYEFFGDPWKVFSMINDSSQTNLFFSHDQGSADEKSDFQGIMLNKNRFDVISTVVVDFQMPAITGIEFCLQINNPYVRKILYTGIADEAQAIQAFNKGLIDGYITKQNPDQLRVLNDRIDESKNKYFQRLSESIWGDPLRGMRNNRGSVYGSEFLMFFKEFIKKKGNCEYYMNGTAGGFTCLSHSGEIGVLYVYTPEDLCDNTIYALGLTHLDDVSHKKLYDDIICGHTAICLPLYGENQGHHDLKKYIQPLKKVGDVFVAYVEYPGLQNELNIVSFEDFQKLRS